jgi:hypothetical protein
MTTTIELPLHDGFDVELNEDTSRIIQSTLLKFRDGLWFEDGAPFPAACLTAIDVRMILQRWQDQKPIETLMDLPLPDVDHLNSLIPENEWEEGIDGKPRPPWQKNYVVYLLNPATAEQFTAINSTVGMAIAYHNLAKAVRIMRRLRGDHVLPIVKLGATPMKTKFGVKQRPHFEVIEWCEFGASGIATEPNKRIGSPVTQPTAAEFIDDELPF